MNEHEYDPLEDELAALRPRSRRPELRERIAGRWPSRRGAALARAAAVDCRRLCAAARRGRCVLPAGCGGVA